MPIYNIVTILILAYYITYPHIQVVYFFSAFKAMLNFNPT